MKGLAAATVFLAALASACGPAELSRDEVVAAFIAASQNDARTMHMEWRGTLLTSQQAAEQGVAQSDTTFSATFEFSGADYEGVFTTSANSGIGSGGSSSTTSYAQVGGVNFTRYEGSGWQRSGPGGATPESFDPMAGLTVADITYEGPETLDGRALHRLRVTDPLGALRRTLFPEPAFGAISPVEGGASDFLLYVDGQGIPAGAQLRTDINIRMADPNSTAPAVLYRITSDYTFSQWAAPITIVAPPITNSGGGGIDDKPPQP